MNPWPTISIPQMSFLISDRWNTDIGEVGLLVDVSYKDIHVRQDQILGGAAHARSSARCPAPARSAARSAP